jgi:type II secretory pathway pseudopilin PulG
MVEIAICLAIIGFALVAIIGVLPIGMNTQRDNREETIINQDATLFIEAIRNGSRGLDDLTNYVYAITNYWTQYNPNGTMQGGGGSSNSYTFSSFLIAPGFYTSGSRITNGMNIIGLLSTPEYTDYFGDPTNNLLNGGYSNHVVAYVRSISGPAVEKPPQNNDIVVSDSFGYRILCVNAPVAVDTNIFSLPTTNTAYIYNQQLAANLHELRLTFLWPQLPNGGVGPSRQTFRTMVAGQIMQTNYNSSPWLYFYQSQSFINAP